MALRFDRGTLRAPKTLSDGSIRVDAVITRAGVFEYGNPDGSRSKEYRPPAEVFKQVSLDSFVGMAVTNDHPYADGGLVSIENRSRLQKGVILEGVRRDGNDVVATLVITDAPLIADMRSGKTAVSCGYEQDIVKTAGTSPDGERYDAVQTNIRGNHVAIVDVARAGDTARVRMDGVMIAGVPARSDVMDLQQALAALALANIKVGELSARADSAERELGAARTRLDTAEKERDVAKASADAAKEAQTKAEKARTDAETGSLERAREFVALENVAAKHLRNDAGEPMDVSRKTASEIKLMITEKLTGKSMAGKSEAYVAARYDAAIELAGAADDAVADVRDAVEGAVRADGNPDTAAKARNEMITRQQNAWKKGN